jgi:hypothetical protein
VVATALPARSVAPVSGVHVMLAAAAARVGTPLGVPSLMVTVVPLMDSVDAVPVSPNVMAPAT